MMIVLEKVAEEKFPVRYLLSFFANYQSANNISVPMSSEASKDTDLKGINPHPTAANITVQVQ